MNALASHQAHWALSHCVCSIKITADLSNSSTAQGTHPTNSFIAKLLIAYSRHKFFTTEFVEVFPDSFGNVRWFPIQHPTMPFLFYAIVGNITASPERLDVLCFTDRRITVHFLLCLLYFYFLAYTRCDQKVPRLFIYYENAMSHSVAVGSNGCHD